MKQFLSGNEAVARGLYEAGVSVGSAYPGTPSTEIFENLSQYEGIYHEWAPNEKVAVEVAYGASIAGVRAVAAMKHVGLNVAADPLFTAAYNGVEGGFVIISADDPGMHSSQNEQDNRHYARAAKVPMFEPADSQDSLDMIREAFEVSERFDIPVLFRMTTRVCHARSLVEEGGPVTVEAKPYKRNAKKHIATPANAIVHRRELEQKLADLSAYSESCKFNRMDIRGGKVGVVTAGGASLIAREVFPDDSSFLTLGFTHPLPLNLIRDFAGKVETLYVVEELDGFMEEQIKAAGIPCIGKDLVPRMYELNPTILKEALTGEVPELREVEAEAVPRPPVLCPGCPHRGFFYTLSRRKKTIVTGDIGCYALGGSPPLSAMDTTICMGAGFTVAMGMAKAFEKTGADWTIFGVVGDSTFFHSGITGAIEIFYNKGRVIPVVLDNSTTAMTGQQENPGTGYNLEGEVASVISIEGIFSAIGYKEVITVDPQDLTAMKAAIEEAAASAEPCAMVVRRPCVLIKRLPLEPAMCYVDRDLCTSCRMCLRVGCPAIFFVDGKAMIDRNQCVGCTVCLQVCPFDAIKKE
ncbi:MAG TPA: indolepyruvate ferredoxin oxidoreductase subunit alpha [Bacillota bacterium]|jgi:indolepyruvate ferredoxin oxidoreductase alpha subunit|nr:indolepyruvate ferredoxin oxidoreductase subunit alpha [Fastidiosipila sp.]HPX93263.1 indolepyruvate ferredoxin oxidoreductase subunit alpha [Bacillota bacterium]HQB80922.1 indolepyruvate ferredoxin oxidoreductase subunit alpha [Bacillota bacterium]